MDERRNKLNASEISIKESQMSIKLRKNFLKSDLNFRERQTPQMDLIVPAA